LYLFQSEMNLKKEDIIFIINPNSGKRKPDVLINKIKKIDKEFAIYISRSLDDFNRFIKQNINKYKVFVIAGGDGTINETAKHLFARKDKALAIIPLGSGNGFAREMGFQIKLDELVESVMRCDTFDCDVIEINNNKFINVAGIGFDACVAHIFDKRKKRGLMNYILATVECLRKFKNFEATLQFEDKEINKKFSMITFANTRQFGNNAYIAPKAIPHDGKLDVVMIEPLPFFRYPGLIYNMFRGKIKDSKYITHKQISKELVLNTDFDQFHLDGEPVFLNGNSKIKIHEKSLRLVKTDKLKFK